MAFLPTNSTNRPVDPVVVSLTYGLANPESNYIVPSALPPTDTNGQKTGTIMGFGDAAFFGDPTALYDREPGGDIKEAVGPSLTNVTFRCRQYSNKTKIPEEKLRDTELGGGDPNLLKAGYIAQVVNNLRIAQEARLAAALSAWSVSATPANKWDTATGDPIRDLETGFETVAGNGPRVNMMVVGRQARRTLKTSPAVLEFLKTTENRNILTDDGLKNLLSSWYGIPVSGIHYADGRYNSAAPGQTVTLADLYGDWIWLGVAGNQGFMAGGEVNLQPCAIARLESKPMTFEEWWDPSVKSWYYSALHEETLKTVQSALGYLIDNVTT